ncbi:hypothetical protein ACFVXD_42725, partial [Kitasatospora herbaricolor]
MTAQSAFDPARSAAIRELLIQTVDDGASRPSRRAFAVVAALTGVALALAGGTAALALSGVLRFDAPEPAPAPPSVSVTPTPSPTPTPTPTPTERPIAVQTAPIARHDVDSIPPSPSWTLTLPGADDPCVQHGVYDIAEGLALFKVGAQVVGDSEEGCDLSNEHVSLSLVNTSTGEVIWSRTWTWAAPPTADVDVDVLGTSGRVLVVDERLSGGPHDVIDLTTGRTVGEFQAELRDVLVDVVPVPGDSGDVLVTTKSGVL